MRLAGAITGVFYKLLCAEMASSPPVLPSRTYGGRRRESSGMSARIGSSDRRGQGSYVMFRRAHQILSARGVAVRRPYIGEYATSMGLTFNGTAASTIGALFASACLRAGREVKGRQEIGLPEVAHMLEAALLGIQERGKAQVGDKTVLDALSPAAAAAGEAVRAGAALMDGLRQALAAAEAGVKATVPLKSKIGRAAWITERTVGHQDPGATSFYLMFKSALDYLARRPEDTRATEESR